jgi:hypothetical protein
MSEYKRIHYYLVERHTGKVMSDIGMTGGDSYIKRLESVRTLSFPTTPEMRDNLILVNMGKYNPSVPERISLSKIKGLTVNEIFDEYEFRKYGTRKGKWKK